MQRAADYFESQADVAVAFLFGSRAREESSPSDWDFALCFNGDGFTQLERLARLEQLKSGLAEKLQVPAQRIDLVDLNRAPLGLRITVAEEGRILKGSRSLDLFRFYQRAWRAQEEFHFRKAHGL
jgi:predicted nucleotidyltransferase